MKFTGLLFIISVMSFLSSCSGKPTDEEKKIAIETILEEYNECVADAESNQDCKTFTARAICEYNGIDDLKKDGQYIMYNEIYDFIKAGDSWKSLGFAPDQEVMKEAQDLANQGYAVIAINTEDKHKFVVLIVKGELSKSGKWDAEVPSCAAFFPASSSLEAFINKTINYAWSKPEGVEFFVKR
ncbi:MAG: hypothetical protein H6600_08055 [Flavobacteriales bacterium]|nr:hypothetical protein [Flavobacteriales bacterium]MCB9198396.1 hypothetical protein [Flavobacteriales bacterium]